MLRIGDYVEHNTFPPVEGYVRAIMPVVSGIPKIGVIQSTGNIYWDMEDTWSIIEEKTVSTEEDFIDVEFIEIKEEDKD